MANKEARKWIEVGAAWKKEGKKGLAFSMDPDKLQEWRESAEPNDKGKLTLFVFKNEDKQKDSHPDYRMVGPVPENSAPASKPKAKVSPKEDDDDLPF